MCFFSPIFFIAQPLAGGYYQSYLYNQCPGSTILTVESNPTVVAAARDFFGFEGVVDPHAALLGHFGLSIVQFHPTPTSNNITHRYTSG